MNKDLKKISVCVSNMEYNKLKKEAEKNNLSLSLCIKLKLFMKGNKNG